jgi:Ca-activated chloride channel family protein
MSKHRNHRVPLLTACVVLIVSLSRLDAGGQVFKSGVELVPLTVTVTNAVGRYTTGLNEADFAVFEEGIPQPLSLFADGRVPLDVAFVVDTSSSMGADLPLVKKAVHGLLREFTDGDRAAVIELKKTVGIPQPLSDERDRVGATIDGLHAGGSTAMYDGVYVALKEFERAQKNAMEIRRRVLILLSDGVDTASHVTFETVLDLIRRLDVNIYTITLNGGAVRSGKAFASRETMTAAYAMRALATEAGGRAFFPTAALELPPIYQAISNELAFQYVLGYVPMKSPDGQFRRVSVRVLPPASATARTRTGYFAARTSRTIAAGIDPGRHD